MAAKVVISGVAGAGKTTLIKDLPNTLVISHDGKKFGFKMPNRQITSFDVAAELIANVNEAIIAYNEKFGTYPETVVFDSVSRIFDTLYDACNRKYTGFAIYSKLDAEIKEFTSYIEETLIASNMNVILISHAIFDPEENKYNLVGKGSFSKTGGFFGQTDQAIFIELKGGKRILHFRSTKFPARTLTDSLPDSSTVDEFTMQSYIETIATDIGNSEEYSL